MELTKDELNDIFEYREGELCWKNEKVNGKLK